MYKIFLKKLILVELSEKILTVNLVTFFDIFLNEYIKQMIVTDKLKIENIEQKPCLNNVILILI